MKRSLPFLVMPLLLAMPAAAQSPDEIYEIGTNVGVEYLSEYSGRLRINLILMECNFTELASEIGRGLPNTVEFFMNRRGGLTWPMEAMSLASQVMRAYVLGYETGVRTEFEREISLEYKRLTCSAAAAAAGQLIH